MYDYIPRILPLTLEQAQEEIQRNLYEEYAYGRLFAGPDRWDLVATVAQRKKERQEAEA